MNHDNYDNQLLKALQGIDKSLKIIASHYKEEVKVDMSKSLFEQDLPCCHNCRYGVIEGKPIQRCVSHNLRVLDDIDNQCCDEYEKYGFNPYQE